MFQLHLEPHFRDFLYVHNNDKINLRLTDPKGGTRQVN